MNIRSLYSSAAVSYEVAAGRSEPVPPSSRERPHLRKVTDHLILSKQARAVLDEMRSHPDVDTSIRTAMEPEQMSERRRYEVAGRIETGYYREPHVLHRVASSVSGVL